MTTTPTPWGSETTVSTDPEALGPQVAGLADGTFAIVWQDGENLFGQRFSELGRASGGDFLAPLSAADPNSLSSPQIYQQTDGQVVVEYGEAFSPTDNDIHRHTPNSRFTEPPDNLSSPIELSTSDEVLRDGVHPSSGCSLKERPGQ